MSGSIWRGQELSRLALQVWVGRRGSNRPPKLKASHPFGLGGLGGKPLRLFENCIGNVRFRGEISGCT